MKNPLLNETSAWNARYLGRQCLAVVCLGLVSPCLVQASSVYTSTGSTMDWSDSTKWVLSSGTGNTPAYPNGIGDTAQRTAAGVSTITQNIVGGVTVGNLVASGASSITSFTITEGLTMNQDGAGAGHASIIYSSNVKGRLDVSAGTLTLADDLLVSNESTTFNASGSIRLLSVISGTGNMTFSNVDNDVAGGRISVTGANTFTGTVTVAKGAVTFTSSNAFGAKAENTIILGASGRGDATLIGIQAIPLVVNNIIVAAGSGGNLVLGSTHTNSTTYGGTVTLNGDLSLTSVSTLNNALVLNNTVSGDGSIRYIGGGNHRLTGVNTFTGETSIASGVLQIGSEIPAATTTLALQNSTVNLAAADTGTIQFGTAASPNIVNATFGALTGSRNLNLANSKTTPAAVKLTIGNNNTNAVYSGSLTGAGSVVKTGTGTQTFSGNSTYAGSTTVNGGRLVVDGSITSSVTVNNGGTLGGHGSTGAVTIADGGTIAPGNSPGILSVASADFDNGSTFVLDLKNDLEGAGTGWDQLSISGQLDLTGVATGGITLSLQSFENYATTIWNGNVSHAWSDILIFGSSVGLAADGSQFFIDSSSFTGSGVWSVVQDGNTLDLYYAAVPEPATWGMLVGGFGMLIAAQRIRRRS